MNVPNIIWRNFHLWRCCRVVWLIFIVAQQNSRQTNSQVLYSDFAQTIDCNWVSDAVNKIVGVSWLKIFWTWCPQTDGTAVMCSSFTSSAYKWKKEFSTCCFRTGGQVYKTLIRHFRERKNVEAVLRKITSWELFLDCSLCVNVSKTREITALICIKIQNKNIVLISSRKKWKTWSVL